MKKFIFLSIGLLAAEEQYNIKEIVTSASTLTKELKDAPASISVVTGEELKDMPVRDLGEALAKVSGVSIEQGVEKTGGYQISIRGMPTDYTLILMDSKRQNTTSAGMPNGFTGAFTSFIPPIAAIERIEVMRGASSTLYGSDAIGGIVNIITKKQFDKWGVSMGLDTILQEEKQFGNLYGLNLWAGGPLDEAKKWSLVLRLREQYRAKVPTSALKVVPNINGVNGALTRKRVVGLSQNNNFGLGFRLGFRPDERNYFYGDFDHGLQWYDNTQGLLGTIGDRGGYRDNLFFMRNNLIFAHQGKYENLSTDTSIQYNSTLNHGRFITQDAVPSGSPMLGKDRVLLGQDFIIEHKSVWGAGEMSNISFGATYWLTSLIDRIVAAGAFMARHNLSVFAENETNFSDNLTLTLGLRENYNSAFGFNTSPRAYLVYNALENSAIGSLILKGGVSTGYKAPSVLQLVRGINGLTSQGTVPAYGNPNLRPENSVNYEVGVVNENDYTQLSITAFFIEFRDKIQYLRVAGGQQIPVEGAGKCIATQARGCGYYVNADKAYSYGLESFFSFKPYDIGYGRIGFDASYTFNKTAQASGEGKGVPLADVPMHSLNTALNYSFKNLGFYLKGEFRAKQLRTQIGTKNITQATLDKFRKDNPTLSIYYKPYFLLHLGGSYQLTPTLKLHFGIYNLLNQNFMDFVPVVINNQTEYYNSYNFVREGRRYYLSLNMEF